MIVSTQFKVHVFVQALNKLVVMKLGLHNHFEEETTVAFALT